VASAFNYFTIVTMIIKVMPQFEASLSSQSIMLLEASPTLLQVSFMILIVQASLMIIIYDRIMFIIKPTGKMFLPL